MAQAPTKIQLRAKARAISVAVREMPAEQRKRNPSGAFGTDYNRLRQITIDTYPDLKQLMPPEVFTAEDQLGISFTRHNFSEIDSFCEQIYQLLADAE